MAFFCKSGPQRPRPSWSCSVSLAENLIGDPAFLSARAIEIRQPDPATVLISAPDDPSIQPRTLSRSHRDFECDASGLTVSMSGSDMNAASTVLGLLVLHVGVASSTRSFRPLSDGSLLMEVTNKEFVTQELVSGTIKEQAFMRWDRDPGDNAAEKRAPKESEAQ
jgi:hypothetical protein